MAEISESFWRSLSEETGCSLPVSLEDEFRLVEGSSGGWNGLLDFILKQPIEGSTEVSESAENQSLIRSPSDLLWDSSRVVLSSTDPPTFINATHVSLPQIDRHYVLTQSPLLSTMSHFWSMVWQLQVRSVLMMNLFNEKISVDSVANQIHFYLPIGAENGDTDVKEFGDFVIRYETRESFPSFDLTRLQVTQKSTEFSRSITHYAFKSWTMDTEDVPLYTSRSDDLLEFVFQLYSRSVLDKVSLSLSPSPPVLVHCSDGLGRSAALALLDYCLQIVKRTNSTKGVKIPELVHELREQRRGAITAGDQLKTVYTCLLSGASKLLSHKPAVPLDTWESRESDDESVDLETQQTQDLDSSGDDFEIIQKPRYSSSDVGQDSGSGEQMSSIESSSEATVEPFQSASLVDTPSVRTEIDAPSVRTEIDKTPSVETRIEDPFTTNTQTVETVDTSLEEKSPRQKPNTDSIILSDIPPLQDPLTPTDTTPNTDTPIYVEDTNAVADDTLEVSAEESVPTERHVPADIRAPPISEKFYSIAPESTPDSRFIELPPTGGVTKRLTTTGDTNSPPPKETLSNPSPTPVSPQLTNEQSLQNMSIFIYLLLPIVFVVVVILVLLYLN